MPYNEQLADRIREALVDVPNVEERELFGGLSFMVNDKMCIGIRGDEMMCRINPDIREEALEKNGAHEMVHGRRVMKAFVLVSEEGIAAKKDFDYWVRRSLEFNHLAKASKKRK